MHVIEPTRYRPKPRRRRIWPYPLCVVLVLVGAGAVNYFRPLPVPILTVSADVSHATQNVPLTWPGTGQAAVAAAGYGLLDTNGNHPPVATASIAKIILALCVLQKAPLARGETGPTYTIDAQDMAIYNRYVAENGSVLPVVLGEQLTEYEALEALMIPSANNIADSLAAKLFGGQTAYATYATNYLRRHELNQTTIGPDASGYDAGTTSTASDLTQLGLLALKQPALMEIAGKPSATFPVVGTVSNYDTILGINGITGLKTGNNDTDLGAFLFTADARVGDGTVPLTGAILGAPALSAALQDTTLLVKSLEQGFEQVTPVHAHQQVGTIRTAWSGTTPLVTTDQLRLIRWKATPLTLTPHLNKYARDGNAGTLELGAGTTHTSTSIKLARVIPAPGFWWRLTRH